jgi:hypothetical protein
MTFLEELTQEIENTEVSLSRAELEPVQDGERRLGTLPNSIRKIHCLRSNLTVELEILADNHDCEVDHPRIVQLGKKLGFLFNLLWLEIYTQFKSWDMKSLGIREDWMLVDRGSPEQECFRNIESLIGEMFDFE